MLPALRGHRLAELLPLTRYGRFESASSEQTRRLSPVCQIVSLPGEPTVSVVVPFYGNDVSALRKCVASLLDQDYSKDRTTIIVIDNNETASLPPFMFGGRCKLVHE